MVSIPVERFSIRGNPNIGIYIFANDHIAILPPIVEPKEVSTVETILRVKVVTTTIGGMSIVGALVAGNNKGIVIPSIARSLEVESIKRSFDGNVCILKTRYTALGNIILVNDRAALVHPEAYQDIKDELRDALDLEVVERGTIANIPTVGSAAFVNNVAGLVHPDATDKEIEYLSSLFSVPIATGTVNFGVGFIRSGLVANSHGILVGSKTTGPEMMRIMQVFGVKK
ncbi:MAG: translation initiation factor IF-6 [Crenarchaeota archaeon]|nr:translation initiation factor IF-6 [Thermoproteota archaeon]